MDVEVCVGHQDRHSPTIISNTIRYWTFDLSERLTPHIFMQNLFVTQKYPKTE